MNPQPDTVLAVAAATAAAAVLPAASPLSAVGAQPGNEHVTAAFAGAAIAPLEGPDGAVHHRVAVLVGEDLVRALAESPLGGLDLAAATQPAIDAAAQVLGMIAGAARQVELDLVVADLGGSFTAVPLVGQGIDAAVLMSDSLLVAAVVDPVSAAAHFAAAPVAAPAPAAPAAPAQAPDVRPAGFPVQTSAVPNRGIEMLAGVDMEVTVELGRTRMPVRDLLALAPGVVLELDRAADGPADLLVNGRLIARGEVVVVDEDFGLRITEILDDTGA
ncbi:flagellar motor switch protein FliN [Nocardioides houyundeii]|uniref:flagellar motor switch protein FliN n=1 Tax=Nocardioides houyundeii TaxID=2045452 RepID=UPI000DF17E02|nr:flagellar motor switch protein FliN [Nocardioides houyundeii]